MKRVLLIIEDDLLILETTADLLETYGFEVLKAGGGEEGVQLAKNQLPDLIICDILMPGLNGHEVLRRLQSDFSTADIPFIFLSSLADKQEIRRGMELGADDYLSKPVDPEELVKIVKTRIEKSERLIKHKELRYHILFDISTDAILMISPQEEKFLDANLSALEILAYSRDEVTRLSPRDILPEGEWEKISVMLSAGNASKKLPRTESRWRKKDGTQIPVQSTGQVIDILGENYFLLVARDISDIMFKEQALKESEERYKELVENIGEGIGVVDLNERFTYVNPTACEIFGLSAQQLIGQKLLNFIHPSSHNEILRQTQARKQGQKSIYEVEVLRLDGQKRWIIVTATPQYDSKGNFSATFGIFRDITRNKMAEVRIRESEERLMAIVDLTNDYIWEIDPSWRYTYVSSKIYDILGYRPEELLGKSPFDFMLPGDVESSKEQLKQFVREYKPLNMLTNRAIHRDGHIVYLESSGIPLFDENGKYSGYRGADRDITIRKNAEHQLIVAKEKAEESDRLKSSILANVSHELRTPLNGILGFAEILKTELKSTDHEMMAENIHASGRRLMGTLNSLITLSQLVAGKVTLSIRSMNLKEALSSVIKTFIPMAEEKQLTITLHADPALTIETDEQMFKQLLRQFLDNAVKFTEKGGVTVQVDTQKGRSEGFVVISIMDTGIGIEKDHHDVIFQEFRQVSEGFGRKYQGSGIGLTICKKTIELLDGRITLDSDPGKGSAFHIWLPFRFSAALQGQKDSQNVQAPKIVPPEKKELPWVLLVEDNLVNKELTEFFLRKICRLDYAPDGNQALAMVKKKKYHAILMDINLGYGISGIETTKEIRKLPEYEKTPIIAVTGYAMSGDKDMLIAQGCTHYLAKPFDQASILEIMESIMK